MTLKDSIAKLDSSMDGFWNTFNKSLPTLAASLFMIFTLGIFLGLYVASNSLYQSFILFTPLFLGVLALWSRNIALILFILYLIYIFNNFSFAF
jgi:hypothetical protein